jgi:DNA-binding PadR family transcriptional regulator
MRLLTRKEELIMLAVFQLGNKASLVNIRKFLNRYTKKTWSPGNVYVPLDTLTRKKYLDFSVGEPSPRRGGKAKKYYRLTDSGMEALEELRELQELFWAGMFEPATKE